MVALPHPVHDAIVLLGEFPPLRIVGRWIMRRPRVANDHNRRVFSLHGLCQSLIALLEGCRDMTAVANADISQSERCRMARCGALSRHLRSRGVCYRPLYHVERVLASGVNGEHGYGFCAKVLAKTEKLI